MSEPESTFSSEETLETISTIANSEVFSTADFSLTIGQLIAVVVVFLVAEVAARFITSRIRSSSNLDDDSKAQYSRWIHIVALVVASVFSLSVVASKAAEHLSFIWNFELFTIAEYTLHLSQVLAALIVLAIAFTLSRVVRISLLSARFLNAAQAYVYARLIHYVIIVVGFFFAVSALGFDVTHMAMIASALGIGVGLGLQDIVKNFVAGLAIMLERSIKVGDYIELHDEIFGEVMEIQLRSTRVRTNDNVDVVLPNAELTNGFVTNWTLLDSFRRFKVPFGVAYGSDKELVKKAVLEAAAKVPYTIKTKGREPSVWMTGFGDSSLDFELGVWIGKGNMERPRRVLSDYLWAIDDAFREYGIEVPFPQRDVHFRDHLSVQRQDRSSDT